MSCPFFMPTAKAGGELWQHPRRLPLGAGWSGHCTAPGHEGAQPGEHEVRHACNLGYATECARLPRERPCDAVRFAIACDRDGAITVQYVLEARHLPAGNGLLQYDVAGAAWSTPHADARIQRQAACYLESYLERRRH